MPVKIELTRKSTRSVVNIQAKDWVCCTDCGLLMSKRRDEDVQWSICEACVRVYSQNENPWIAKMLAKRINNIEKILVWEKTIERNSIFQCSDCKNIYLQICKENESIKKCDWCILLEENRISCKALQNKKVCCICHKRQDKIVGVFCDDCKEKLSSVGKGIEYSRYMAWIGRYKRGVASEAGKPLPIRGEIILKESLK